MPRLGVWGYGPPRAGQFTESPMPLPENKTIRVAMIPWVMAIIALIGLNALASVHRFTKKQESGHESAISELSDEAQTRGRMADPLVYIEPTTATEGKPAGPGTHVPHVDPHAGVIDSDFKGGRVRGRAPPLQREI